MIFRKPAFLVLMIAMISLPLHAQETSSKQIKEGQDLALGVCGACHVVTRDQKDLPVLINPAPSFASIVNQPGFSVDVFRQYLTSKHSDLGPHQAMPNPRLVDYQIDEIIAYVLTLRTATQH